MMSLSVRRKFAIAMLNSTREGNGDRNVVEQKVYCTRKTTAVHVSYNSRYISLLSCVKIQREMTKF